MELTILILLLPFLSFLILGIGGKWMSHRTAGAIGTLILGAVAVLSYVTAFQYFSAPRLEDGTFATLIPYNFTWLPFTETLRFDLGILLDPISVMMLIVISTVSLMVHIYSFGYMKGETFNVITLSCPCLRCLCWDWLLPQTFSRCIFSGNWWVSVLIC